MAWLLLFIAGFFEVVWATGLKYIEGGYAAWPEYANGGKHVVTGGCAENHSCGDRLCRVDRYWSGGHLESCEHLYNCDRNHRPENLYIVT